MMKTCKNITILFVIILIGFINGYAQSPQKVSYQAIIRDNDNKLISDSPVSIELNLLTDSINGTVIFTEKHQVTSNSNGLITLIIGGGQLVYNDFSLIDWSRGPFFLQTRVDPYGNEDYTIEGISQLLSVPFALHANTAEKLSSPITETDPSFKNSAASTITSEDISNWNLNSGQVTGNETQFEGWDKNSSDDFSGNYSDLIDRPQKVSAFSNDAAYLTEEIDPDFNNSVASTITETDITNWNEASSNSEETDPVFNEWDKSSGIQITKSQISDLSFSVFEKELSNDENNINVGFNLTTTSSVFVNGASLPSSKWTGIGTQTLILKQQTKLFDNLKVVQ